MNISPQELMAHPLMAKVTADIAETRAKQEGERVAAQMEALRLRGEHGKHLAEQHRQAVNEYERIRKEAHAAVGRVWTTAQDFSRLTGANPQDFPANVFNEINLPTLKPQGMNLSSPHTTTHIAIQGYFATMGKQWI